MRCCRILLIAVLPLSGQKPEPLQLSAPLRDKNFYALTLVERTPGAATAGRADTELAAIAAYKRAALAAAAAKPCQPAPECNIAGLRWGDAEIARTAAALARLYRTSEAVRALVDGPLRDSGIAVRHHALAGDALLAQVWRDSATGMNRIFDIYAAGEAPRYAAIDSPSFAMNATEYQRLVHVLATVVEERGAELDLFFSPSLAMAAGLLEINRRDEAARFEPLEKGENRAAYARIATIDWKRYPYTAIVVPGSGTDRLDWNLSPYGRLRIELAARRYRTGKAPFLLVSGGFVHPNQTPFAEAIEMKKSLMADFGVPEDAILVEPHARHTTTNLRNAARILYRYGVPLDAKVLVTTDSYHSASIESAAFAKRCLEELGYLPHQDLARTSAFDLEVRLRVESLQTDPSEPLDP